jgi:eukaryotic-like serine/threonine-protein kinase
MPLEAQTHLGPYEILSPLGAGGMGEVYRAKDTRLDRFVAIKVLPEHLAQSPDALARFEREAKAVAALNHPNILALHDIGTQDGTAYAVMELLEGESLRARLSQGPLPPRKATDLAVQMAQGLAAAHEKGVIHRDLKPENLWITTDGRLKILDFGLARVGSAAAPSGDHPTLSVGEMPAATDPGTVLGTVGYMSPEQVRGQMADARSDIFSFGAVLYEMLSGDRAFARDTAAETMTAILKEDPPEFETGSKPVSPGLQRVVHHCLEKAPAQRFHDAHDLAFALENLSSGSGSAAPFTAPFAPKNRRATWLWASLAIALVLGAALLSFREGKRAERRSVASITFRQKSFRPQAIFQAAFAPDGETIVYSAALEGHIPELFVIRPEYPEPSSLGLPCTHLLSISSKGELAILTKARFVNHRLFSGMLARVSLGGSAPREILEDVRQADWSPDGTELAIVRSKDGRDRLEFPIGKVLYEAPGYLSDLRVSPRGDRIALFEHPAQFDDRGAVIVVDRTGRRTVLSDGYQAEEGLCWSPAGDEVLFSANQAGSRLIVYGVDLSGRRRVALTSAGGLTMHDVSRTGRWLVTHDNKSWGISVLAPGAGTERDLTWLDSSSSPYLSRDGRMLLFTDYSSTAGQNYQVCLRATEGGAVVRLGEGDAMGLSPDGKWALAVVYTPPHVVLYPTGPGEARSLPVGTLESIQEASWFPDGKSVVMVANEAGRASRCYAQEISGGPPHPVTPEGTSGGVFSPDGLRLLYLTPAGTSVIQRIGSPTVQPVPGLTPVDRVVLWSGPEDHLFTYRPTDVPTRLERLDLASGRREFVREIAPADRSGVLRISGIALADDTKSYAYSYVKMTSQLFVVEGAR